MFGVCWGRCLGYVGMGVGGVEWMLEQMSGWMLEWVRTHHKWMFGVCWSGSLGGCWSHVGVDVRTHHKLTV